jgi:hypothetical protein
MARRKHRTKRMRGAKPFFQDGGSIKEGVQSVPEKTLNPNGVKRLRAFQS